MLLLRGVSTTILDVGADVVGADDDSATAVTLLLLIVLPLPIRARVGREGGRGCGFEGGSRRGREGGSSCRLEGGSSRGRKSGFEGGQQLVYRWVQQWGQL